MDRRGAIVLVNLETERLFGYTRDELVGQSIERLVPVPFHDRQPAAAVHKDGSHIPVEIALTPIEAEEGSFVLASITDIRPRNQAEAEPLAGD